MAQYKLTLNSLNLSTPPTPCTLRLPILFRSQTHWILPTRVYMRFPSPWPYVSSACPVFLSRPLNSPNLFTVKGHWGGIQKEFISLFVKINFAQSINKWKASLNALKIIIIIKINKYLFSWCQSSDERFSVLLPNLTSPNLGEGGGGWGTCRMGWGYYQ